MMNNNPFDEMRKAVRLGRETKRAVQDQGNAMLELLDGNLRGLSRYRLERIKRELRDFNIKTGEWK